MQAGNQCDIISTILGWHALTDDWGVSDNALLPTKRFASKQVRLFLNGAIKIVKHCAVVPLSNQMFLATAGICCTISPPLSGVMEDCSIVRVQQLQLMLYHRRCCISASQRILGSLWNVVVAHEYRNCNKQESPAIADKPARRESLLKLLQFNVLTTLSLTILAYFHSFSCCCVRNLRNPTKFSKNSNLWSSRSSTVIDLVVNGKPICDFILVINSNFSRICYRFRDIHC